MASRRIPVCVANRHNTDDVEFDSILGWDGWCYTCQKPVSDTPTVMAERCTECHGTGWHCEGE